MQILKTSPDLDDSWGGAPKEARQLLFLLNRQLDNPRRVRGGICGSRIWKFVARKAGRFSVDPTPSSMVDAAPFSDAGVALDGAKCRV